MGTKGRYTHIRKKSTGLDTEGHGIQSYLNIFSSLANANPIQHRRVPVTYIKKDQNDGFYMLKTLTIALYSTKVIIKCTVLIMVHLYGKHGFAI